MPKNAKKRAQNLEYIRNKRLNLSLKFSKGIFASYFLFMITFVPCGLLLVLDFDSNLPHYIHLLGYIASKFNSIMNLILYGSTCELFLKGYKNFLNLIFDKKNYSYLIDKKERLQRLQQSCTKNIETQL